MGVNKLILIAKFAPKVIDNYKKSILPEVLIKYKEKIDSKWNEVINNYMNLEDKGTSVYFFTSFAPCDISVGSKFNTVTIKDISYQCKSVILAILQEWTLIPVELVPLGYRCACIVDFPDGIPDMIRNLKEVEKVSLYNYEYEVVLSNCE